MTHTYKLSGMTCGSCAVKVRQVLSGVSGVKDVIVDFHKAEARVTMERHIPIKTLQDAFKEYPKYTLAENGLLEQPARQQKDDRLSWVLRYKPILIVFSYIAGVTIILELVAGSFNASRWMQHFMGGFFLVFSFFKMLDLRGFADSYSTYDIVAKQWKGWGYVYAFFELFLGIGFLTGIYPLVTNVATFILMGLSVIGVLKAVLSKKKIRCACLGTVFNLPMSTITITEDVLMIGMSLVMIFHLTGL